MKPLSLALPLAAALFTAPAFGQVTFTETFDDGAAATRWSAPIVDSEVGIFDGSVDYGFDYGAIGIATAPGGGSATGVLMQSNLTDDGPGDEGESFAIIPEGVMLPEGSFKLTMDVYFNWEAQSSGTTEYGIFGVHTAAVNAPTDEGLNDDVPFRFGLSQGNGLAWSVDGDAGSATDIFRFEDPNNGDAGGEFGLGSFDDLAPGSIPGVSTGPNALGPGGDWIEVEIERFGKRVSFSINGVLINEIVDAADAFEGGSIMLGYADWFNSVGTPDLLVGPDPTPLDPSDGPFGDEFANLAHFIIFDNVTIAAQAPEPGTLMIVATVLGGMAAFRRR